jgi:PD-(D/E)XK nuclease superfamily protein
MSENGKQNPPLFPHLPSQGARAVRSGKFGQLALEMAFKAYGVNATFDHPEFHYETDIFGRRDRILIREFEIKPGFRVDYVFRNFATGLTLAIECKNQMGKGTTDEKLHYTVNRLVSSHLPYWLIVSGGAFRPAVTAETQKFIEAQNQRTNVPGRMIFNAAHYLQRAVERLIERNEI